MWSSSARYECDIYFRKNRVHRKVRKVRELLQNGIPMLIQSCDIERVDRIELQGERELVF